MTHESPHCCVHNLPISDWEKALEASEDGGADWIKQVRVGGPSRYLLQRAYYRAYYRICRRELARRGLGT